MKPKLGTKGDNDARNFCIVYGTFYTHEPVIEQAFADNMFGAFELGERKKDFYVDGTYDVFQWINGWWTLIEKEDLLLHAKAFDLKVRKNMRVKTIVKLAAKGGHRVRCAGYVWTDKSAMRFLMASLLFKNGQAKLDRMVGEANPKAETFNNKIMGEYHNFLVAAGVPDNIAGYAVELAVE
jgi:hypothetical protein